MTHQTNFDPNGFDFTRLIHNKPAMMAVGASIGLGSAAFLGAGGAFDGMLGGYYGVHFAGETAMVRSIGVGLAGLAGFGLGWFCSPAARPLRALLLGSVCGAAVYVMGADQGMIGNGLASFAGWVAFAAGLGYWMRRTIAKLKELPTTFGSARWASLYDMIHANLLDDGDEIKSGRGFHLGYFGLNRKRRRSLTYQGDRHMLTFAPTRAWKGIAAIVPNLLTYAGSVMVIDPKGENALITAKARAAMGQKVHVVDPFAITGMEAAKFNPMDWLVAGDVDMNDNAMLLADAIIVSMGESEQFWTEEAKALLLGVILFVATDTSEDGRRNLGRVRELLTLDGAELTKMFKRMLHSANHIVRSCGARCLQKEEKLLANVLASVQAQTHFLESSRLADNLSASDFTFEDLKDKDTTIYLVLPSDKLNAYGRWLRLLIQQAITVNARNIEKKPDQSVLFILDEMPALGKLTMVEQAFGLMAGYGMQIWGICQDASQLKRIYGDGWETFVSNAGVIQYFGSRDNFTAEYFSKLCGVTTVWNVSTAIARAFGVSRGKDTSRSETTTTTDTATGTQRKLAYADELTRLPKTQQLILIDNLNPIIAEKQPWFKNPALQGLGVNLHEQAEQNE